MDLHFPEAFEVRDAHCYKWKRLPLCTLNCDIQVQTAINSFVCPLVFQNIQTPCLLSMLSNVKNNTNPQGFSEVNKQLIAYC